MTKSTPDATKLTDKLGATIPTNGNAAQAALQPAPLPDLAPWLAAFYAHLHQGGAFWFEWTDSGRVSQWHKVGEFAHTTGGHKDRYFGIHPVREIPPQSKKGSKDKKYIRSQNAYIAAINCLYGDFDAKDFGDKSAIADHLDTLPLPPSVIIDSGGGYHCYWLLVEPYTLDSPFELTHAQRMQAGWVKFTGGDKGAKDLAHVLRVPGTMNYKKAYAPDYPTVTVVKGDLDLTYNFDDLVEYLPDDDTQALPTPPKTKRIESLTLKVGKVLDLLPRLSPKRRDDYAPWLEVGIVLHHELGDLGLPLWDEWSQESEKYAPGACADKWPSFAGKRDKPLTMGSLITWARSDRAPSGNGGGAKHLPPIGAGNEDASDIPQDDDTPLLTDMGNSTRFAGQHGDKLKFTENLGWIVWTGRKWELDETLAPDRLARKTARGIFKEAATHQRRVAALVAEMARVTDDDTVTLDRLAVEKKQAEKLAAGIIAWAIRSQSRGRLSAMLDLARSERDIVRRTRQFDKSPWLFNAKNGTLDLRTGVLTAHRQEDLLTHCSPVAYDPGATCPTWDKFLLDVFAGDTDLVSYVQKAVGYSLTGDVSEQCLFFLYGTGANGKSTFANAVFGNVLDSYHKKAGVETILQRERTPSGPNNDVARLRGARAVVVSEIPEGRRVNESLVKDLTGGDPLAARFLHREYFEFTPEFKLFLYGNHRPVVKGTDVGIWRRMRLIPFTVTFEGDAQDRALPDKLKAEAAGILAWAVRGCQTWQREGLSSPKAVKDATQAYRTGMDVVGQFLGECTVSKGAGGLVPQVTFSDLYAAYARWCDASGERAASKRKFGERLIERGLDKARGTHNVVYVYGVGLNARAADEPEKSE